MYWQHICNLHVDAQHRLPPRFVSAFTQGRELDVAGAIGAMMCAVMPEDIADRLRDSIATSLKDDSLEAAADVVVWLVACWAACDPEGFAQLENEVWFEPLEAEMRAMVGRWLNLPDTEKSVARRLSLAYSTSDDPRRKDQRANLQEENVGAYGVLTQLAVWSQLNDLKRAHDELQRVRVEEVSLLEAQCASQEERLVTLTAHYNRQSNEEAEACRDLRIATEKVTNLAGEANKARQDSKSLEEALLLVTGQTSRAAALEVAERQGVDREEYCVKLAELEEEADRLRHALAAKLGLETDLRRLSLRNASLTKELEVATTLVQQLQKAGHDLKAAKLEVERLETRCFSLTTELASEREGSESRLCTILSLKRSLSSLQVASASPRKEVPAGDSVEMSMEVERLGTLVVQLQSAAAEKEAKLVELSSSVSVGEELANRNKQLEVSLQDAQTELRSRSEELACAKATCSQIEEALTRVTGADAEKHTLLAKLTDRSVALCESLVQEKARYERCLAELEEVKSEAERAHVMEIRVEELTSQVQDMEARRETERSLWAQQQADWTRQHALSTHVSDADVQRLRHGCDDLRDRLADAEKRLAEQSAEVRRASQARIVDLENRLEAADTHLAAARCELDKNAELRRRLEAQLAHTEARRLALSGELANASAELRSLVDLAQAAAGHTANEEVVALREMCANLREGAESGWATDSDIAAVRKQLLQKDWAFCEALSDKQRLLEELRELKASHAALKLNIWEAEKTEVLASECISKRADSVSKSGTNSKFVSESSDCGPVQSTPVVEGSLPSRSPVQSTPVVERSLPSSALTPVVQQENAPTISKPPVKRRRGPRGADDADECKNQ